ncbi:MAG: divergent PAP2 family protein [Thermoflexus sp.]|jgi:acid phosphatase family membrane protein YuiD|nr:divergent PAP2 family protein [Thermoflexus sp.]
MEPMDLLRNPILILAFLAWTAAQLSKVPVEWAWRRRLDLSLWFSAGGMPSSHAALVSAMATAVGLREGFTSTAFAISLIVALIVMYDATGVRRAASIQARILNQILSEMFAGRPLSEQRLKELIGHTPMEVLVGALLGVTIAWLWWQFAP